jgi:hypothetical protein
MSEPAIVNAKIKDVRIFIEDHGILTMFVDLDYGGSCQGFGGYRNDKSLGFFAKRILEVLGEYDISRCKGKICRVRRERGLAVAIGHPLEDKWFEPGKELESYKS